MTHQKLLFLFLLPISIFGQVVDFENFQHLKPGDPIGTIEVGKDCRFRIFSGYNLKDSTSLTLQKVGFMASSGGYYGPKYDKDCNGNQTSIIRKNQINDSLYALNPDYTNRERIGCYFISGDLAGKTLPSVFIQYEKGSKDCGADLLDVDGHENTIEAYDIYYYASTADYPHNPINKKAFEIRSKGKTYGPGLIGDNGGVMPFKIHSDIPFILIEFRPIQQITPENDIRYDFGFAFDNFSPNSIEKAPFTPPYLNPENNGGDMVETNTTFQSVYFGFDQFNLSKDAIATLNHIIAINNKTPLKKLFIDAFTDPEGDNAYNQYLSQKRAESVKEFLLKNGFKKGQIEIKWHGELYDGSSQDPDWKKRTVQIRLEK